MFIYFENESTCAGEGQGEGERGRGRGERERERERESQADSVLTAPPTWVLGLELTNREIVTRAEIKSWTLN